MVEVFLRCRPVSPSHCLALRWFRSRVRMVDVGPQLGRAVVGACRGVASALYFDSAGSAVVVFGLTLVVGRGVTLLRCFVVLYSRCFPLYYFLE
ncbi:hypothetical protein Taro_044632 [Colocasia esculenta]|uniref:Uncharacterized protein n=1 Tax=Colocasia esculenta TaxID=4460 RepID=A0A843X3K8_COLES|nr:hypothetical protein [Colocasia esculenta]